MKVMTARFGAIEIDDDKIIEMPEGVIGFTDRRFILLLPGNNGPFFWFQSLDDPAVAFVVTDPVVFFPAYEVNLTSEEYQKLAFSHESAEVILLAVTTITQGAKEITINLQGPIVVNPAEMRAKQIVLESGKYGVKHPLFFVPETGTEVNQGGLAVAQQKILAICNSL